MPRPSRQPGLLSARLVGYLMALGAVTLVSAFIGLVLGHAYIANISLLYLLAVFASAMAYGSGPAILASLAAFLIFDWFFVPPIHQFTIDDPSEWIALLFFLVTALITGQLTAAVRARALQAARREREATVLYDVVRLLNEGELSQALRTVAARLQEELDLAAVAVEIAHGSAPGTRAAVGESAALDVLKGPVRPARRVLSGGVAPADGRRAEPGTWVRVVPSRLPGAAPPTHGYQMLEVPIKAGDRRLGTLALVQRPGVAGLPNEDTRLLSAAAAQLAQAVERARLQQEATEAEILRRTDELKTALLNAVSHDLRTPLASIIASAGSLRQRDVPWSEVERQELAEAIEEEALRLNRIVGNLLDLSRIEAGNLRPEKGWYDVGALVDEVIGRLRGRLAGRAIHVAIPEDLPPVQLDYVQIDQVLTNLVENAAKYTPSTSAIEVTVRHLGEEVEAAVADRGPGVPPAALPRLFERFYRVEGAGPRPQGTGLGLTVAKGLVEAHGGRIWAENRPGGGARFVFTLPLTMPGPPPDGTTT